MELSKLYPRYHDMDSCQYYGKLCHNIHQKEILHGESRFFGSHFAITHSHTIITPFACDFVVTVSSVYIRINSLCM